MAAWPQNPKWNSSGSINGGNTYMQADGVTLYDMNRIVENMLYLKKYGGKINVLSVGATVSGNILKLKSEEA